VIAWALIVVLVIIGFLCVADSVVDLGRRRRR
jgi:hypothetical protein